MTGRRRIWSELLPLDEVREPRVLALLRRYGLDLLVAVRPDTAARLPDLAAACAGAGVPLAVWPMLADDDGRWAGAGNAAAFGAFVARVLDALDARGLAATEVVFDLEPPISAVRSAQAGLRGALALLGGAAAGAPSWSEAERAYAALSGALEARGAATSAAVVPLVLLDGADRSWERLLGTPVSAAAWGHVSVMLYTSMLEGWSRGLLGRADAVSLLGWACRAAVARFGPRAGASLGAVDTGALGDEPIYRSVQELREDVAVAAAAGAGDLTLFDLGGVLRRPPAEAWLEAFVAQPAALPRPLDAPFRPLETTPRARFAVAAGTLLGRAARASTLLGRAARAARASAHAGLAAPGSM
jgi:hypothetical protein